MRKRSTYVYAIVMILIIAYPICSKVEYSELGPVMTHSMIRFETHSEQEAQDDYAYHILSMSRQLQNGYFGNIFWMYKYSLDENDDDANSYGINLIKKINDSLNFRMGYTFTDKPRKIREGVAYPPLDKDRFSLSVTYASSLMLFGAKLSFTTSYDTQTDWSEGRTISEKISMRKEVSSKVAVNVYYQYTHNLARTTSLSKGHFYDQYGIDIGYKLDEESKISLGYLFVNKIYEYLVPGVGRVKPDDDSVVRLTYMRRL